MTINFPETKSKVIVEEGKSNTYYIREQFYETSDLIYLLSKGRKTRISKRFYQDVLINGKKAIEVKYN